MAEPRESSPSGPERQIAVGRRVFLGLVGLGAAGVVFGAGVQSKLGRALGSGLASLLPGGDRFQIYSVSGSFPSIPPTAYRLEVSGLVERPLTLTLADLETMPAVSFVKDFQCVTGWRVPDVQLAGRTPRGHSRRRRSQVVGGSPRVRLVRRGWIPKASPLNRLGSPMSSSPTAC